MFLDPLVATGFSVKVTLAAVAVVVAAMAAAFNIVIAKRHLMLIGAVPLTLHQMVWGTLGLGITGEWRHVHYSLSATLAVLYLGLAGSAAAFVMYYSLLRTMRAGYRVRWSDGDLAPFVPMAAAETAGVEGADRESSVDKSA